MSGSAISGYALGQVYAAYGPVFSDGGAPLGNEQAQALAEIMADLHSGPANPDARSPGYFDPDPQTFLSPADHYLLERAGSVLSASQLEMLKSQRADENQQRLILRQYGDGAFLQSP